MININGKTRKIKLTRREVIDLLIMLDCVEEGQKWNNLHDKIKAQLDEQDQDDKDYQQLNQ